MLESREYIGISLEEDVIKIARVQPYKKGVRLVRLDQLKLTESLKSEKQEQPVFQQSTEQSTDPDPMFGFGETSEERQGSEIDELDLDNLDTGFEDLGEGDLVDESSLSKSNEEVLVRYLDDLGKKKKYLVLNIPSGDTIFQVIKNNNYHQVKRKQLADLVLDKLNSLYGHQPAEDFYDYLIRKNGALVIASVDSESATLRLVNNTKEMYGKKYHIRDVIPDEAAVVGLYRRHYQAGKQEITALLQFSGSQCRMIFMRGHEVLHIPAVINEGTKSSTFLNTVFSKILFQLDTGEIPELNRIIIFNNTLGEKAIDFLRKNFSSTHVAEFSFNKEIFSYDLSLETILPGFTTAIGIASSAVKSEKDNYPALSFLPNYIAEKQKTFKLQWHGYVLLFLIGMSPAVLNYFYQKNLAEINRLENRQVLLQSQIADLNPLVEEYERLSLRLSDMQDQLTLLTDLSRDNIRWSVTFDEFNSAVEETDGMWISSFRQNEDVIMIDGYSMNRENIPELAGRFPSVTLLSVRRDEVQETELFFFTMMVRQVVTDQNRFTQDDSKDIEQIINP